MLPAAGATRQDILRRPLGGGLNLSELMKEVARHYLDRAMDEAHGNKTKAAKQLGISPSTLYEKVKKYKL